MSARLIMGLRGSKGEPASNEHTSDETLDRMDLSWFPSGVRCRLPRRPRIACMWAYHGRTESVANQATLESRGTGRWVERRVGSAHLLLTFPATLARL